MQEDTIAKASVTPFVAFWARVRPDITAVRSDIIPECFNKFFRLPNQLLRGYKSLHSLVRSPLLAASGSVSAVVYSAACAHLPRRLLSFSSAGWSGIGAVWATLSPSIGVMIWPVVDTVVAARAFAELSAEVRGAGPRLSASLRLPIAGYIGAGRVAY